MVRRSDFPPHQRAQHRERRANGEPRLRPYRGRQDMLDHEGEHAIETVERRLRRQRERRAGRHRRLRIALHLRQQPRRRMHRIARRRAVEHQRRIGLPAALHGVVIERAGADAVGLEAGPGLGGERSASFLADCADQAANKSAPASPMAPLIAMPMRTQLS